MSSLRLLNTVVLPIGTLYAGSVVDPSIQASVTAAGGTTASDADANILAAANLCAVIRFKGGSDGLDDIMQNAAALSLSETVATITSDIPTPTAAGKLLYDTGTAYAETAAGSTQQVLHGAAGAPTWGAVDLTADVTGLLPGANISPAANSNVQVVQDAGTMSAGSLVVNTGITVTATSKFLVTRNDPDVVAAHWGKLSAGSPVVGGPGTGSVTISSANAADTSSVSLTIFG
jgi:hypothetical protein